MCSVGTVKFGILFFSKSGGVWKDLVCCAGQLSEWELPAGTVIKKGKSQTDAVGRPRR